MAQGSKEKEAKIGMSTVELKTGKKIKVLNRARIEAEIKNNLPLKSGEVGIKKVKALRDSGCNGVIVERKLLDEGDFIETLDYMMTVDRTLIKAPIAMIEVDFIPELSKLRA